MIQIPPATTWADIALPPAGDAAEASAATIAPEAPVMDGPGSISSLLARIDIHGALQPYTNPAVLYTGHGVKAAPAHAAPKVVTGAPIDIAQMESLNKRVQSFKVDKSPVPEAKLRAAQQYFQDATDALKKGDYKAAEQALGKLGFPLPPTGSGTPLSEATYITAHLLGVPADHNGIKPFKTGANGHQGVNDVNGFAANARMMNRMAGTPGGVSNPPTEQQSMAAMRNLAHPPGGKPPATKEIMQGASEIVNGSIMHYSSAGATDPVYDANPNPHAFYRDRAGRIHEFDSPALAHAAAKAGKPPVGNDKTIYTIRTNAPDAWSDISSHGARAGRNIGDCESKLYLQTRLLTEAGLTSIGSIDVQPPHGVGGFGHMFGVFRAQDGSVWVTSNEQYRQVQGTGPKGAVTQADLDKTVKGWTAEIYHVRDASKFTLSAAATSKLSGPDAAVDSIRRSVELKAMGRSETLLP